MNDWPDCGHRSAEQYTTRRNRHGCRACDREGTAPPPQPRTDTDDTAEPPVSLGAVAALAAQLAQAAVDASPALALARFRFALDAWASAEARRLLIAEWIDSQGLVNTRGTPRLNLLAVLGSAERAAARGRDELGLSPEGASRIALALRAAGADLLSPTERTAMLPLAERRGLR
jgi:hypothetical protein